MGKLSEAMKIVKWNLGNFGESFLVNSGKLKTRFATDLLLEEPKRFNTVSKPKVDHLVGGHACRLFELKELADTVQNCKKLPKNPER